jgi:hypothetical protein
MTATLTMSFADLIFRLMSGEPVDRLQQRFRVALQAVDTINDLCAQPIVLRDWFFSEEHCHLTARLLGAFTGFAGVLPCPPDHGNIFLLAAQPALLEEAPFLNTVFLLMLSRNLHPLALAQCLARARFGNWSDDRRTFFSDLRQSCQGLSIRWGIATRDSHNLGTVYITFQGDHIVSFHFMQAWPTAHSGQGATSWTADSACQLSTTLTAALARSSEQYVPATACSTQPRTGTVTSAEVQYILDGHFTVAKNGLPVRPIFQRNHPSWEDNAEAQEVLILVLSEWFNAGSLEYVELLHRLPHCILAVGRVPKNTAPLHRIVTDARAINIYAEGWRIKYATVGNICLMLTICALIWIIDLKNVYHLVRLGGCRCRTEKLL